MALAMEVKNSATANFEIGKLRVKCFTMESGQNASSLPKPVIIATPLEAGTYPVVLFLHGYLLSNKYYRQLLQHIASHGFILVAPLLLALLPCSEEDIKGAAATTDWLSTEALQSALPEGVEADLLKLALAGHSRGGHAAFSLALGYTQTALKFSALIGIDPVAGPFKSYQIPPKILTYKPSSFDLGMPVLVIGSGLGEQFPACAPEKVNHKEFYYECKPPCYHFVVSEYGHLDLLDDDAPKITKCICKSGKNCRDLMRRSIGGIATAFLKAYFEEKGGDLKAMIDDPQIAPTAPKPISYRKN